jgi:hypothetical protein
VLPLTVRLNVVVFVPDLLAQSPDDILQAGLHPTFDQLGKKLFYPSYFESLVNILWKMGGQVGRWVAKKGDRWVIWLLKQLAVFESRHLSKIQNGRHKQRSGQHTLACQKNKIKINLLF